MKQKMKQWMAYILSFCMIFSMMQMLSADAVYAAAADGEIEESAEGDLVTQTVRYFTNTETASTSNQYYLASYTDRLTDFIAGTESMTWSVEFKTSDATSLQGLLLLERNDKYCALYLKNGNLSFEPSNGNVAATGSASYADNQYHTAKLEIQKDQAVILSMDGREVARNANPTLLKDLSWTPTAFTIGGSKDYSSPSGWKFTGSMKNIVLQKSYIVRQGLKWQGSNLSDSSLSIEGVSGLENATLSMSYRLKEASEDKTALMKLGSDGEIYVDPANGKAGVSIGSTKLEEAAGTALGTTKWHNVALVKSDSKLEIYVDGSSAGSVAYSGNLDLSTIQKGGNIYCSQAEIYEYAMDQTGISDLHKNTNLTAYPDQTEKLEGYFKGPNRDLFNVGFDNSKAYRIPAITTSYKTGTVIASIDKRCDSSADGAVTDTVIRRSEDNGVTWGDPIMVIDMPDQIAYTTDPEMVTDNDPNSPTYGRIYILVDQFPKGISWSGTEVGTGYKDIDGKKYQILTTQNGDKEYTIREGGVVYDSEGNPTEYQVETEAEAPYRTQGDLYKNGKKIGSIYKDAELKMLKTCYLWITYSDDDGLTWSRPRDLNPEVKADWMSFFGTGPGAGIQLKSGRLVFSTYCNKDNNVSHFSSYNIYTDDHGETWHRGGSPNDNQTGGAAQSSFQLNENCIVELDNGHLIQFMKNASSDVAMAVSEDRGETWGEVTYATGIPEVYCQLAVLHYGDLYDPQDQQIKEAIVFANPAGPGRTNGKVRIAFVNDDDTLDWKYSKLIEEEKFLYNSMTLMKDGNIGMIYENEKGPATAAAFTSFSAQYIMDPNIYENTPQPSQISVDILDASGNEAETVRIGSRLRIKITFDNNVFAAGNVTSNIQIGNEIKEADLIGNIDKDTLEFEYAIQPEDTGDITVLAEVNVKEGGAAETIYNVPLTDKPYVTNTVSLGRVQAEGFVQLPTGGMSVTTGSEHNGTNEGPASHVLNDNRNQYWHTKYDQDNAPAGRSKHWITLNLGATYLVSGLKYLPRENAGNGTITKYQIEVSTDGETFYPYAQGNWALTGDEKTVSFEYGPILASHVMLRSLESTGNVSSASAVRIIGSSQTEGAVNRGKLVQELLKYTDNKELLAAAYPQFVQALNTAEETALNKTATQAQIDSAFHTLTAAVSASLNGLDHDLDEEMTAAAEKNEADYTITSWSAYQDAVTAAEKLADNATQEEKLTAYLALKKAAANLALTDAAVSEAEDKAESQAGEAIGKLETLAQGKNNSISMGDMLPLKLEDGTDLKWSTNSDCVSIDSNGRVIVTKDLENETDVEFTVKVFYGKDKSVSKSRTVKVKPLERYTVIFDADGGAPDPDKQTIMTGETAEKPKDPSKAGYTFAGWYLGSAATPYNFNTPVTGNITLKAKWTKNQQQTKLPSIGSIHTYNGASYKVLTAAAAGGTVSFVKPAKKSAKLIMPDAIKIDNVNYKVVSIENNAFKGNKKLKNITIGANIERIGKSAFEKCSKLSKITIKSAVLTKVERKAIKGINKKCTFKVPKKQKKAYQKLFKKAGWKTSMKMK